MLFAGQGAQTVGMGKDFAETSASARTWFDRSNDAVGCDLAALCFNGPEDELTKTENAQPGIFLIYDKRHQLQESLPDVCMTFEQIWRHQTELKQNRVIVCQAVRL